MFATMESEGTDMPSDVAPLIEGHTIREVDELADLPGLGENSDSEVEDVDCEVALRQGHLTLSRNISGTRDIASPVCSCACRKFESA